MNPPRPSQVRTVLVVDDDEAVRLVAGQMLASLDCHVDLAAGGAEALELLAVRDYALVLLDVGMPGMTGAEVYKIMRERLPGQQVAFMTGFADEDLSRFGHAEARVLHKPFSMDALFQFLNSLE